MKISWLYSICNRNMHVDIGKKCTDFILSYIRYFIILRYDYCFLHTEADTLVPIVTYSLLHEWFCSILFEQLRLCYIDKSSLLGDEIKGANVYDVQIALPQLCMSTVYWMIHVLEVTPLGFLCIVL